jgi:predicted nucleotide-binding protein
MKKRSNISEAVKQSVLLQSRRRCAVCFAVGDLEPKTGSLHHILPISAGGEETEDNLVFLCAEHNVEQIAPQTLRTAREKLYAQITKGSDRPSPAPKVFVVHAGLKDEPELNKVTTFLTKHKLEPIVLSHETGLGRTVPEIMEEMADARYAIVLLTPERRTSHSNQQPRLNGVFELGFFMGRLGRLRVCALYKPPIELPSEMHGALYVEMDRDGLWRKTLTRELRTAGFKVGSTKGSARSTAAAT